MMMMMINHVTILRCDVSLITTGPTRFSSLLFSDINFSQGTVATRLWCDGIFYCGFARNLLISLSANGF